LNEAKIHLPTISGATSVWFRNFVAWRKIYKTSVLLNFGEPVMSLSALGFGLGAYVTLSRDMSFSQFIGPGLLATTVMNGVSFDMAFGAYERLRSDAVYDAMLTTPLTVEDLAAGEYLWQATRALLYGCIFLSVIVALGMVTSPWAILILPLLVITGVMFASPALAVAAIARAEEHLFYYFTLALTPMFMFAGIFFPIDRLPTWAQVVIASMPLYHAAHLFRSLAGGHLDWSLLWSLLYLIVLSVLLFPLPLRWLRRRLII
jgi:lipooligosaccharide transport system permease protein